MPNEAEKVFNEYHKKGDQLLAPHRGAVQQPQMPTKSWQVFGSNNMPLKPEHESRISEVFNGLTANGMKVPQSVVVLNAQDFEAQQKVLRVPQGYHSNFAVSIPSIGRTYLSENAFTGKGNLPPDVEPEHTLAWVLTHESTHLSTGGSDLDERRMIADTRDNLKQYLKWREGQVKNVRSFDISHLYMEHGGLVPPEQAGNAKTVPLGTLAPDVNPLVTEGSRAMGRKADTKSTATPDADAIFASFAEQGKQLLQPFKGK